jgi:hypothetical protein
VECAIHAQPAKKKKEVMSHAGRWMEPEIITISEINQTQRTSTACFLSNVEDRIAKERKKKKKEGGREKEREREREKKKERKQEKDKKEKTT